MAPDSDDLLDVLSRSLTAVGDVIDRIRPEQWSAPTPCTDWTVSRVTAHLGGMNLVFIALLDEQPLPRRDEGMPDDELVRFYRDSAADLTAAFGRTGVLERTYVGPLGAATGAERLQIRLYDLLAHGWDLAVATGQPAQLPEDAAELALAFARAQLTDDARPGRFASAQTVSDQDPVIERLVAFLGRRPDWRP